MLIMGAIKRLVKSSPGIFAMVAPLHREYVIWMSRRPIPGDIPVLDSSAMLVISKLRSFEDYLQWRAENQSTMEAQQKVEDALVPVTPGIFFLPGTCALCGSDAGFECDFSYTVKASDGRTVPNFRELVFCRSCGFKNRMRGAFHLFVQECKPLRSQAIYITEQFGTAYRWLKGRFTNVSGSEYISSKIPFGSFVRGIRNEDLCALTWPDQSFDFVLSFDVLEHVADANAAFSEIFRCLRPGGRLLFTAPFSLDRPETYVMARFEEDGSVTHFCEPEYHGNPTDPLSGALCLRYFGWDTLDCLKAIGFRDAEVWLYWSKTLGYVGGTQIAISAVKP